MAFSIRTNNGMDLSQKELILNKGWEIRESTLLSCEISLLRLIITVYCLEILILTFGSHSWSGEVQINLDNTEMIVDLYSINLTSKTIILSIIQPPL